jgi:hypothetical protein
MHILEYHAPILQSQLLRLLVCTLLPACIQEAVAGTHIRSDAGVARSSPAPVSAPYLRVCLPPPLRFADPVELVEPVARTTVAGGPPHPSGLTEEIAASNHDEALTAGPSAKAGTSAPGTVSDVILPKLAPIVAPGVSVLPDDTPRDIRAEDVLMYFQYAQPAVPSTLPPPSSATYQQK